MSTKKPDSTVFKNGTNLLECPKCKETLTVPHKFMPVNYFLNVMKEFNNKHFDKGCVTKQIE